MPAAPGLTVVKLGGSHAFSQNLRSWIETLAGCGGRAVIVPGGGPFANTVRAAQVRMKFDDRAAHRMALLAMEQYGCAIGSFDARLKFAPSLSAIRNVLKEEGTPVWLPTAMVLGAEEIPASWEASSDSLAAWLAGKIRAKRIVLVKQVELRANSVGAADLVARGVVDPLFSRFLAASGTVASILGPADAAAAARAIRGGTTPGIPIDLP